MLITTISHQRSGTKLLGSLLGSTGAIEGFGEIFNPDHREEISFRRHIASVGMDQAFARGSLMALHDFVVSLGTKTKILHADLMFNQIEHVCISWNDYQCPFVYGYMKTTNVFAILLTRKAEDIFISNKMLEKSHVPHQYKGSEAPKIQGTLTLKRSEYETFKSDLEFHYETARRSFRGYPFFYELDYSAIQHGGLPDDLFAQIEKGAHKIGQHFEWSTFPAPSTPLIKNKPVFDIDWED